MYILGISAYYHDSAACLILNDQIIAAAQEERFTRKKHDASFPINAIKYCLDQGKINLEEVSTIAFYDKPLLKFERLLDSYYSFAPKGFKSFTMSMPVWLKEKLYMKKTMLDELDSINVTDCDLSNIQLAFPEHHLSHAASAFYPSPFEEAAFITVDGVGEYATTTFGYGKGNKMTMLGEIHFPDSLGLLYSAFTYFTGFKVNSGEYKVMGLAPYGNPVYVDIIKKELIDIREDGSFKLNQKYFDYVAGLRMTNKKFAKLFGGPRREPEQKITQREMDLAASVQVVVEETMIKLAKHVRKVTGMKNLVMAGGVALNCVANGKIWKEKIFDNIWVQPAAGDAGGALGAAYCAYHIFHDHSRVVKSNDNMKGSRLGPEYSDLDIDAVLEKYGVDAEKAENEEKLLEKTAEVLAAGNIIGWFQGRMEFGPRALGSRSIIGDARNPEMQRKLNLKIKFRESFRPFAPIVLKEDVDKYFDFDDESPYMLMVAPVKEELRIALTPEQEKLFGIDKLNVVRSEIPAITHVNYSARLQTVDQERDARLHGLLKTFKEKTGSSVLVNTSFNVRGEPIVNTPEDAYRCFMRTDMDFLVIGNYILSKDRHKASEAQAAFKEEFAMD